MSEDTSWVCPKCERELRLEQIHWHGYYPVCLECYCWLQDGEAECPADRSGPAVSQDARS